DFVLVSPHPLPVEGLREICARFDREKLDLFRPDDLERGFFDARDDRGNPVRTPLVPLAVTVIARPPQAAPRHPAIYAQRAVPWRHTARVLAHALRRSAF